MIFYSDREEFKAKATAKLSEFSFFILAGGALGAFIGGSAGLLKGIPLQKTLPRAIFRNAAFFGSISAVQSALELGRNEKDALNPLLAGGWTGFIFGHGLTGKFKYGLALSLNAALINWAVQYFTLPHWSCQMKKGFEVFNPVFTSDKFNELTDKIDALKLDIDQLKEGK